MGGWNRRWHTKSHYDGSRRPPRPSPSPPHAGYNHGNNQCPVPLWEREFCSLVGDISWQRFCENKNFVYMYKDIEQWDDSGAFENFQNVKSRFWANYHGQPSDIPLPDPDMYIDRVNQRCSIDPELIAELDKVGLPFEVDNESGLSNAVANNKCAQNQPGNWDVFLEKPVAEVNKWEEDNTRSNLGSNLGWGIKHEGLNSWSKNSSSWGHALEKPGWGSSSNNNHCSSNNWNSPTHGASNSTYKDPSSTYDRKRNSGGYSQQRNSKQRSQAEGSSQRGRWQDHRGRNSERLPFDNNNRPNGQRADRGW